MDYHLLTASPIGFEPTTSCVTGKRALRCSTRTNQAGVGRRQAGNSSAPTADGLLPLACLSSSGGTRTHSISGSKPKWSANCLPSRMVRCLGRRGSGCRKSCFGVLLNTYPLITYSLLQVEHRGIEPRFSACKTDVLPLDEHPELGRSR